jgi:hypothetical protein
MASWLGWLIGALPWTSLLKQAPSLVKAADALLSNATLHKTTKGHAAALKSLDERVAGLEAHDRVDAELMKRLAEEMETLTRTAAVVASRAKAAMVLSGIALAFGLAAVAWLALLR